MKKEIIINSTNQETRIAILEDGQFVELFVERPEKERTVGDIFKGRVARVLPGMRAAFIGIGQKQDAFLHFSDIAENTFAFIDVDTSEDEDENENGGPPARPKPRRDYRRQEPMRFDLRPGQDILVQVTKEPYSNKGPRVTSSLSLPGRFLVLIPENHHVGVSKKISSFQEKRRLRRIARQFCPPGFGMIIRTVAEGKDEASLKADLEHLVRVWERIQRVSAKAKAPSLVHKDLGMASSVIRDLFTNDVERAVMDTRHQYKEITGYLRLVAPNLVDRVELYKDRRPVFDTFKIEEEIQKLFDRKVYMKNGGYIIIEPTEALVSIDINSGRFIGKKDHEQNSLRVNLDAAREIARQLRLRDLGGLIVIDFIDVQEEKNRKKIYDELKKELAKDRAKTSVAPISEFGLIEMTRQRIRQSLLASFSEACPTCEGTGRIVARSTTYNRIERWFRRFRAKRGERFLKLIVNPEVAEFLEDKGYLRKMRWRYLCWITLGRDDQLHHDEFRVLAGKKDITDYFEV